MNKFCPSCGENVETYTVDRVGTKETLCIHCGMIVDGLEAIEVPRGNLVMVADDSPMIREILKDVFISGSLAEEVIGCRDGYDFLSTFAGKMKEHKPVALIVLDVNMPILNGVNAAIAIRALEKGFELQPVPILFFTAQKCDENFQKVLNYCKPAQYVNKGVSSTPDQLASRVTQVAKMLLQASQ